MSVDKRVSEILCSERSNNILSKISDVDFKLEKWITNHASHMQADMKRIHNDINSINEKILFIMNKFENDELLRLEHEKDKKNKKDWNKYITSVITGIVFSLINILLKIWGII